MTARPGTLGRHDTRYAGYRIDVESICGESER
jgi:hypothetical protein